MVRKHAPRLGRGLDSLVSRLQKAAPPETETEEPKSRKESPAAAPKADQPADSDQPNITPADRPQPASTRTDPHHTDPIPAPPRATVSLSPAIPPIESDHPAPAARTRDHVSVRMVPIEHLRPNPYQPRTAFSPQQISELAKSISESGILQPIVSRETSLGDFEIIAGERRWRAAKAAGLTSVPVLVRRATDREMLEWALIENIHREDLNAMDRARAYRRYCDAFHITAQEVADRIGEDRTTVANYLRLVDLPEEIAFFLESGRLSMGHARALLGVSERAIQLRLASEAVKNNLSVRRLEGVVRRARRKPRPESPNKPVPKKQALVDPFRANLRDLESQFEAKLGTHVQIEPGRAKGTGRIVIEYSDLEEFDRIARDMGIELIR